MSRHRMSPGDAAWLHMDRRTNRSVVTSVMWFDEQLDRDELRALLQARLVDRFPRFSQRVDDRITSVWWEDVDDFDLDAHLHLATLEAPGGPVELQRYVSGLLGRPLDRARPLWEMHLVDGYQGTGCALVSRMHHCIADGIALTRLMMSLTDDPREAEAARLADSPQAAAGLGALLGRRTQHVVRAGLRPVQTVSQAAAAIWSITRLATLPPDAHTALRGPIGVEKSVVWSEPLSLATLRDAAHAYKVTVNDLVLTAISGALRAHLARTDGAAHDVRAVVPANLRPPDKPLPVELGNAFGLLYVSLPLSVDDPRARLAEVRRRTQAVKSSPDPFVTYQLLGVTGHLPYEGEQVFVDFFATKASLVITNVAGPRQAVHLAGRRVRGTIGWPPESGKLGLGLAIISYDGGLVVGVLADDLLIDDPRRLVTDTCRQLDQLVAGSLAGV
jgi:diacylglycerol O-acyltransferase / wax synthase